MEVLELTPDIRRARDKWRYRGDERPAFAAAVAPGEESVWDYPRPPRTESVVARLRVEYDGRTLAASDRGVRILETAGAPTYYFPSEDVASALLVDLADRSMCEWKGLATSFGLIGHPDRSQAVGWRYDATFPEFASIHGWSAFYPGVVACYVGDEQARRQAGGYYGGWVTAGIKGPIKGEPGSEGW